MRGEEHDRRSVIADDVPWHLLFTSLRLDRDGRMREELGSLILEGRARRLRRKSEASITMSASSRCSSLDVPRPAKDDSSTGEARRAEPVPHPACEVNPTACGGLRAAREQFRCRIQGTSVAYRTHRSVRVDGERRRHSAARAGSDYVQEECRISSVCSPRDASVQRHPPADRGPSSGSHAVRRATPIQRARIPPRADSSQPGNRDRQRRA